MLFRPESKVTILSGVPGSGKSYLGKMYKREEDGVEIVSADAYFYNDRREFNYNPSKIGLAHQACFRNFIAALQSSSHPHIIVDNTNLTAHEISPYYLAAESFGYSNIEIVRVVCPKMKAFLRQKHGVPFPKFLNMWKKFQEVNILPYWNVKEISNG